ncbi:MAG: DUF1080 domain-containing protein [Flavobacteriaceae bacterium]
MGCKEKKKTPERFRVERTKTPEIENEVHNQLTAEEKENGWTLLFDGKTTEGWHLYNYPDSTSVWTVQNGTLYCESKRGSGKHGDLVTDHDFENYELVFEWKLSEKGNSGVFINVVEQAEMPATWHTGPEYQLLDPSHMDYPDTTKRAGCLYGFSPQKNETVTQPAGTWNSSRIRQVNGKVFFYLNGNLTAEEDFTSPEWNEKIAMSGFKVFPRFGLATKGQIALQDWFSDVWYRNIKIRKL